jgi:hypothetical protein
VVLAAATARYHFQPTNWNGDLERALAVKALDLTGDRRLFDNAAETARKIIQNHLRAVQYQARHGRRPNGIGFESLVPVSGA